MQQVTEEDEVDHCDVGATDDILHEHDQVSADVGVTFSTECDKTVPFVGMSFQTAEAVKSFYRQYAISKGFGIKIRNSKKGRDQQVRYFILACAREGHYVSSIPTELKTLPTKTNECPAKITVGLKDGLWYILSVTEEHSHVLTPTKSRLFRGNRKINLHVQRRLEINDEAGIRLNKSYRSLVCAAGGYENVPFVERDVRNFVGKERRALGKEGDGKALLTYFARMREYSKDFFYDIDLDNDFHVRNIFWADARSRAASEYFGDVVSFDTTYLTNKYDMPFAPFVGINHHGQSILLGCGLLSAEDTESFIWLFQSWLRCMSSRAPQGIVTDQCKAMQKAIQVVFPEARHRWCLWHIMKKIPEKLKGYSEYKNIKHAMKNAVYESSSVDDFTAAWSSFIDKFGVGDNEWLTSLFQDRHRWVPCFLKNDFWAGMSTTQRSESINAFFDGYINSMTTLQQFVKQYDNALQDKAEKEYEADFASVNTIIPCGSQSMIERQFQAEYTHAKFHEVQAEFRGKINCSVVNVFSLGSACCFDVMEERIVGGDSKETHFCVNFNRDGHDVNCSCLLFQFKGIMCRHSLLVLAQERVKNVPSKYILARWSKKVRRKHAYMKATYDVKKRQPQIERFDGLCNRFYEIAEIASGSEQNTQLLHEMLISFDERQQQLLHTTHSFTCEDGQNIADNPLQSSQPLQVGDGATVIHSPLHVTRKGRPRANRKVSTTEKVARTKRASNGSKTPVVTVQENVEGTSNDLFQSTVHIESYVDITPNDASHVPSILVCVKHKFHLKL